MYKRPLTNKEHEAFLEMMGEPSEETLKELEELDNKEHKKS